MSELSAPEHARKEQVLTQYQPSRIGRDGGIVLKRGEIFLLATESGDIPWQLPHAFGLFYDDVRFLDGYELTIEDEWPVCLAGSDVRGLRTRHYLTNPPLHRDRTGAEVERDTLQILRERMIRNATLLERITFRNFSPASVAVTLKLRFRSRFQDLFVLKGFLPEPGGGVPGTNVDSPDAVTLSRRGIDGALRSLRLGFDPAPDALEGGSAAFRIEIGAGAVAQIAITVQPCVDAHDRPKPRSRSRISRWLSLPLHDWSEHVTQVSTSNEVFDRVVERAVFDLGMLRSRIDGLHFFAAGVPWFVTLFGRDSALVALQMLPFSNRIAGETARLLARYQAHECDAYRDAEPGKILHEVRRGELARAGDIPQSPAYYGSVDAPLLFLRLVARYVDWSGEVRLADALRPAIDAVLAWIDDYGDHDGDGYLDYVGRYGRRLVNQGWKDSGNAIVHADGSTPEPPIALAEVQGYLYRAWRDVASLSRQLGDQRRAQLLDDRADDLRDRFDRDFWSDELGFYALALQRGKVRIDSIASNGAHVLESGIALPNRAAAVAARVLEDDLDSGWGIRTLSSRHPSYNPMSYHRGSVWPHDNAMILSGLRRYGFDREALRLFAGLLDAAAHLRDFRLPELFCGYPRLEQQRHPVPYPVACRPQAWASASLLFMLAQLLGIEADSAGRRLRIVKPLLPYSIDDIRLRRMRIGTSVVDIRFSREGDGVQVDARVVEGDVRIEHVR